MSSVSLHYIYILVTNDFTCEFLTGDSEGGDFVEVEGKTGEECVRACIEMKKTNSLINGVSISSDGTSGCWCDIEMTGVDGDEDFKSCVLKPASGKFTNALSTKRSSILVDKKIRLTLILGPKMNETISWKTF